jgi:hypothetical protein
MKRLILWVLAFVTQASLTFATQAFAQDLNRELPAGQSVEWQKIWLEQKLEEKVRGSLKNILPENAFYISVQITLVSEGEYSARQPASDSANSDLPLSKLGFWEPLLRGPASAGSQNVFERIAQIDVKTILDTSVPEEQKTVVEEIINRSVAGVALSRPTVTVTTSPLISDDGPSGSSTRRSFADWIVEFKTGISVLASTLIAALLLGALGFLVARDFSSVARKGVETLDGYVTFRKEAAANASSNNEGGAAGGEGSAEAPAAGAGPVAGGGSTRIVQMAPFGGGGTLVGGAPQGALDRDGFEKFRELYEKNPDVAHSLLKKWINARGANDAKALMVLGARANVEELNDLFGSLSAELKQTAKRLLALPMGANAQNEGLDYIKRQVTEQYVSARPALPESTLALVDSLTDKEFQEIAENDPGMAAVLLAALPTGKIAGILNALSTSLFQTVSDKTSEVFEKDLKQEASNIESSIKEVRSRQIKKSVFMEKSVELIPTAAPDKEGILYQMLVRSGDLDLVRETALKFLPSDLVTQVPAEVIQRLLTRMPAGERSELICSQPDERANFLLSSLGEPGAKLRDLVDTEISDVRSDTFRVEALKDEQQQLWANFVGAIRLMQRQNPIFARSLKPIINRWVKGMAANAPMNQESSNAA